MAARCPEATSVSVDDALSPASRSLSSSTPSGVAMSSIGSPTLMPAEAKFDRAFLKKVLPAAMGSFIEWYEFGIYGYMSSYITANFFGGGHGGSLGTWAGFAITFAVRPLGGVFFGRLADKFGRKPAMQLTIVLMLTTTVLQGCLPTFLVSGEVGGWIGLGFMLWCRVVQGLSAGGELPAATVYISEISPKERLGINLAWVSACGAFGSNVFAALVVAAVEGCMTPEDMLRWGWRVPYVTSAIPGLAIVFCRRYLEESPDFEALMRSRVEAKEVSGIEAGTCAKEAMSPTREVFAHYNAAVVLGSLGVAGIGAIWYVPPLYGVQVIQQGYGLPATAVTLSQILPWLLPAFLALFAGMLVDAVGVCKMHALTLVLGGVVAPVPLFYWWAHSPRELEMVALIVGQSVFGVVIAMTTSVYLWLVEFFPVHVRTTGVSIAYNIGIGIFGGLGPLACDAAASWLPLRGIVSAPAAYTVVTSLISLLAVASTRMLARRGHMTLTHLRASPY